MFTQFVASAVVVLCCLAASCHAQGQSCYSASCHTPNYTSIACHEGTMPCPSNSFHCISGSMYSANMGRQWLKRCYVPGDSSIPFQCHGTGYTSRCSSQMVNGVSQRYCYSCCSGNLCNRGLPLRASADSLRGFAPLALLTLAISAVLLR